MLFSTMGSGFPADPDPRGTHLLVIRTEEGPHREQLVLVPLDGGPARELTPWLGAVRNPSWAPGADAILYESDAHSFRDLYRVSREGGDAVRLTDARHGSFEPSLSPDGSRLLFASSRDFNAEIYVSDPDGGGAVRLTDHLRDDIHPRWLPDGRIAWITARDGARRTWTMNADGSDARPARAASPGQDLGFAVARDGRIAIEVQTGPSEVAIEIVDPSGITRVDGPGPDEHPAWSADGEWLAFTSSRAGQPDIWVTDGSDPVRITDDPAPDWLPRFLP